MPDRYLVVKPVIGNTYAAVAGSTSTSEWFRPSDKQAAATQSINAHTFPPGENAVIDLSSNVMDPPAPAEDPAEIPMLMDLATGATGGGDVGNFAGGFTFYHATWHIVGGSFPGGGDDDATYLSHGLVARRSAGASLIGPSTRQMYWQDGWRDGWPPGAIGYEVEQVELAPGFWVPVAEPIEAHLRLRLSTSVINGRFPDLYAYASLNRMWGSGPVTWELSTSGGSVNLNMEIEATAPSLIPSADDHEFGLVAVDCNFTGSLTPPLEADFVVTDFSHAPPYTGLLGMHESAGKHPDGATSSALPQDWEDGQTVEVKTNASLVTGAASYYVIRPPRMRWIYAAPQTVAYRRTYPRDDALAGGAARTWPPSKAVQSSSRTFGGYL